MSAFLLSSVGGLLQVAFVDSPCSRLARGTALALQYSTHSYSNNYTVSLSRAVRLILWRPFAWALSCCVLSVTHNALHAGVFALLLTLFSA